MVYPANIPLPFVHRFEFLPVNSNINLETASFPLNVKINWSAENNTCNGRIVIDDIALNQIKYYTFIKQFGKSKK